MEKLYGIDGLDRMDGINGMINEQNGRKEWNELIERTTWNKRNGQELSEWTECTKWTGSLV